MWTREQIKGNAKYVLSFSYWKAFLACLIVSLVAGVSNMGGSSTGYTMTYQISSDHFSWRIGGIYLNVVKIMFLRDLYTFLWSLLLIIPGVVKSYEYSMIPYILAENPQIDSDRAFAVSRSMTDREKISIFGLDWSFFGWIILGTMACGVGTLFVAPYIQATYTELYEVLKYKVISGGMAGTDELGGPNGYMGEEERGYHSYHATPNSTENGARMYDSAPSCPSQNHSPTGFSQESQNPITTAQNSVQQETYENKTWFEQQVEQEKSDGLEL